MKVLSTDGLTKLIQLIKSTFIKVTDVEQTTETTLATVATTGAYSDLTGSPTIGNATLTVQKNSTTIDTFTANATSDKTINITVPTSLNDLASQTQMTAINSGATSTNIGQITTNTNDISAINAKIPNAASSSNQLADKSFVNSSIATNTANFIGTFVDIPTLNAYSGTVTNNDYAFVVNSVITDNGNDWSTLTALNLYDKTLLTNFDYAWVINNTNFDLYRFNILNQTWELKVSNTPKAGITLNTAYNRYKASVTNNVVTWDYEYTLNNSSFTAIQWAAINSGITSNDVTLINTALQPNDNISDLYNDAGYTSNIGTVTSINSTLPDSSGNVTLTIPTVNNATLTITQGGVSKGTFTANSSTDTTIALDAGGSSVDIDDITITENSNSKLQAIGLINQNMATGATNPLKLWEGTQQQWEQGGGSQLWYNWLYADSSATWTSETSNTSRELYGVAYGNGKFIAVGNSGTIVSSSDGSAWTVETSGVSNPLYGVAYGNGKFIVTGGTGTILSSSDGSTWTPETSGVSTTLRGIAYGNGKFIAVGTSGTILSSLDGSTWIQETSGVSIHLYGIVYGNNKFIIVGDSGTILSSSDGSTWTAETSGITNKWLNNIIYGNGKFITIGQSGIILSSSDGSTWTSETSGILSALYGIAYNNSKFIAVGASGIILSSSDGSTWTSETSGISTTLDNAVYGNNCFIAVGASGKILKNSYISLSCYTDTDTPTTTSNVYSAPNVISALTIVSVGTGTITLSDNYTYNYNLIGNIQGYHSIGEVYPNLLCNIEGVGVKKGTILIAGTSNPIIVNDATITFTQDGVTKGTITLNQAADQTIALDAGGSGDVTTNTDQDITGVKTFVGQKRIKFKQSSTSDKLGFTLLKSNNSTELGYLEYNPTGGPNSTQVLTLGHYIDSSLAAFHVAVGFRYFHNGVAYNLLAPLPANAKTPFSLTSSYTHFYLPLGFSNGTTIVKTANTGVVDLSSFFSAKQDTLVSGTNISIASDVISTSAAQVILRRL